MYYRVSSPKNENEPIFYSPSRHSTVSVYDSSFRRIQSELGCFHTRVRLTSEFGSFEWCAPVNHTRVRLKRVVWGTVQVNCGTVWCWCERNRTKSREWTAINVVLFDKNVCLCVFHSLSWRAWLTRCKQRAECLIQTLEHLQYIVRQT